MTALQVCASRLRSALEPGRRPRTPSKLLVTTSVGYELRPSAGAVDADRFVSGVDDAQAAAADGDPAAALKSPRRRAHAVEGRGVRRHRGPSRPP
ncbi:hypothetical protein ACU686_11095 [Yinghuangia aomiensis]